MSPPRARFPTRCLLALAALAVAALPARADAVYDDDKENYQVTAPENWPRVPPAPALVEKYGVKLQLERKLEKLKDGSPGKGEGARMFLAVQDVLPKSLDPDYETWLADWQVLRGESTKLHEQMDGVVDAPKAMADRMTMVDKLVDEKRLQVEKGLLALGKDREVQKLLLSRYDPDPKKWPTPEVNESDVLAGIPAVTVSVKGVDCPNLEGNPGPCEARMVICVLRKKIYRVTFWVWHQPFDPEKLRHKSTEIEMNFQFIKTTAIPRRKDDKPVLPGNLPGDTQPSGPEMDEKTDTELAMGFSILKPKGWKRLPFDRSKPNEQFFGFRYDINDNTGADINVDSMIYRVGSGVVGFNLDDYLTRLWPGFVGAHPAGVLATHPFPSYSEKAPFLSLPNFEKKVILKRPPPPGKDKEPPKFSKEDLEQKGVITETKQVTIGREKARACWRFCMFGQAGSGVGDELGLHYCFSTSERSFVIRVFVRKDAMGKWGPDLKRMLESFKILEAPK